MRDYEAARRMPKQVSLRQRMAAIAAASRILCSRGEVLLAVVYGGVLEERPIRDLDVAVLLRPDADRLLVIEELRDEIERASGLPVDIVDLSWAPPSHAYTALATGVVLVEREPGLAARLRLRLKEEAERFSR